MIWVWISYIVICVACALKRFTSFFDSCSIALETLSTSANKPSKRTKWKQLGQALGSVCRQHGSGNGMLCLSCLIGLSATWGGYEYLGGMNKTVSFQIQMEMSMASCQKGPTGHAYVWQIGPFWQDVWRHDLWLASICDCGTICDHSDHRMLQFVTRHDLWPKVLQFVTSVIQWF